MIVWVTGSRTFPIPNQIFQALFARESETKVIGMQNLKEGQELVNTASRRVFKLKELESKCHRFLQMCSYRKITYPQLIILIKNKYLMSLKDIKWGKVGVKLQKNLQWWIERQGNWFNLRIEIDKHSIVNIIKIRVQI